MGGETLEGYLCNLETSEPCAPDKKCQLTKWGGPLTVSSACEK
jgi:hypothetical protein